MSGWLSCQTFFILPGTQAFDMMAANAVTHGTVIRNPSWWKRGGCDHYALATDNIPSREWEGREAALRAFVPWNQLVNSQWSARYSQEVQTFRRMFYTS